jgi:hypothetical protein
VQAKLETPSRPPTPPATGSASPATAVADPRREYAARRQDRQRTSEQFGLRERLFGNARLLVFLAGLVVGYLALWSKSLHPLWLLLMVALFVAVLFRYESVKRAWYRACRAVLFYDAGLARLADDWKGRGQPGLRYQDDGHPYAADIDLFGAGSLFELLCTARTRTGEDTLATWLRAGAGPDEVRARQAAVGELRPQLDLREDLALLGSDLPAGVDFDRVVHWGEAPPLLRAFWPRVVAPVIGIATVVCLIGWIMTWFDDPANPSGDFVAFFHKWGSLPLFVGMIVEAIFAGFLVKRVNKVLGDVERRGRDLGMFASVLARLEQASFTAPRLAALHAELISGDGSGKPPSQRIAQLSNLIDLLNSRRNQLFAPFAYLLLWGTQCAYAIEAWRSITGKVIGRWLAVVGQLEALCALAAYAYENPDDPFPEIVEQGPCYDGEGLGHPLMPRGKCVPNDLQLGEGVRALIISGSNMSGKSTFLRTVGINAVMALAGAPVRARRLRISPLSVGATLRIQDSLQAGRSRFYAEILRVRQVVDLSRGKVPLLFLLDEIFAGTNSHDRRLGAEAVVRGLVEAGAIGLVTTHDLSLTHIAESLGVRGLNVHFADHLENDEMKFDFRLRPGVVQHSNALALMRAVGLQV